MKAKLKALLDAVFSSPYVDKADIAYALTSAVVLFKLPLSSSRQAALASLLAIVYIIAHKIENALTSK